MKGMKGRFLKKLKSIRPTGSLKQGRFLYVNASDGFLDPYPSNPDKGVLENPFVCKEQHQKNSFSNRHVQEPEIIDVSELMRDLDDQEMESDYDDVSNKENIVPSVKSKDLAPSKDKSVTPTLSESEIYNPRSGPFSELDVSSFQRHDPTVLSKDNSESPQLPESGTCNPSLHPLSENEVPSFRQPDLNSGSLFDPDLLAAFEQAVMNHIIIYEAEKKARRAEEEENVIKKEEVVGLPSKAPQIEENHLLDFEVRCPPGGSESVVLYTTSLRGIRKTFEDCNSIRFLLGSFRIVYYERDVSMHLEFREELWRILGGDRVVPPRLFIKGRYIGGADEVLGLHEQGKLRRLLHGIPLDGSEGPCEGCAGYRFVLCFSCNGSSRKAVPDGGNDIKCPDCNENGLIICPICC